MGASREPGVERDAGLRRVAAAGRGAVGAGVGDGGAGAGVGCPGGEGGRGSAAAASHRRGEQQLGYERVRGVAVQALARGWNPGCTGEGAGDCAVLCPPAVACTRRRGSAAACRGL